MPVLSGSYPWHQSLLYRRGTAGEPVFVELAPLSDEALHIVLHQILTRILKPLARPGAVVDLRGSMHMADNDADSDDARAQAATCPYRIAFGPRRPEGADAILARCRVTPPSSKPCVPT